MFVVVEDKLVERVVQLFVQGKSAHKRLLQRSDTEFRGVFVAVTSVLKVGSRGSANGLPGDAAGKSS